jgi:thiol-disulfide isomerase/thioredoxin
MANNKNGLTGAPLTPSPITGYKNKGNTMTKKAFLLAALLWGYTLPASAGADLPRVTPETFGPIIQSTYGVKIVQVWASWCPWCRRAEPEVADFVNRYNTQIPLYVLDYNEHKAFANQLDVNRIPTFLLFHDGQLVSRLREAPTSYSMARWVNRYTRRIYGNEYLVLPPKPPEAEEQSPQPEQPKGKNRRR